MSKNQIKEKPQPEQKQTETPSTETSKKAKNNWWQTFISGNILLNKNVISKLPFVVFVAFLFLIYISLRYKFEGIAREAHQTQKQVKDLQQKHAEGRIEYQRSIQMFQVAERLSPFGIQISEEPVKRVIILDKSSSQDGRRKKN